MKQCIKRHQLEELTNTHIIQLYEDCKLEQKDVESQFDWFTLIKIELSEYLTIGKMIESLESEYGGKLDFQYDEFGYEINIWEKETPYKCLFTHSISSSCIVDTLWSAIKRKIKEER